MRDLICLVEGLDPRAVLDESGIPTADLDRMAREALHRTLDNTIWSVIKSARRFTHIEWDEDNPKWFDLVEALEGVFKRRPTIITSPLCFAFSKVLTSVTQRYVDGKFGSTIRVPGSPPFKAADLSVYVESRQRSTDHMRENGGYFDAAARTLKVFVDEQELLSAGNILVRETVFGETEEEMDETGFSDLMGVIIPVFIHEYGHLEQRLRQKGGTEKDFGYVTVGRKDKRRGGYHRDTRTDAEYLRYRGAVTEIDSWSSQAAAEIAHVIPPSNPSLYNQILDDLRDILAFGKSHSSAYNETLEMVRKTFAGNFRKLGLKPEQMEKVWKKFAAQVWQKLDHYRKPAAGKASPEATKYLNPEWVAAADRYPRAAMIAWLAKQAAAEVSERNPGVPLQTLVPKVLEGNARGMREADEFVEVYFFGNHLTDSGVKVLQTFYRLVAKNLQQIRSSNRRAA